MSKEDILKNNGLGPWMLTFPMIAASVFECMDIYAGDLKQNTSAVSSVEPEKGEMPDGKTPRWIKASERKPPQFEDVIVRSLRTGKVQKDKNMGHNKGWNVGMDWLFEWDNTEWLEEINLPSNETSKKTDMLPYLGYGSGQPSNETRQQGEADQEECTCIYFKGQHDKCPLHGMQPIDKEPETDDEGEVIGHLSFDPINKDLKLTLLGDKPLAHTKQEEAITEAFQKEFEKVIDVVGQYPSAWDAWYVFEKANMNMFSGPIPEGPAYLGENIRKNYRTIQRAASERGAQWMFLSLKEEIARLRSENEALKKAQTPKEQYYYQQMVDGRIEIGNLREGLSKALEENRNLKKWGGK